MIRYASIEPVVAMVSPNSQRDRLDTFYYHPLFRDLDQKIASQADQITDIESISDLVTDGTHQTPIYVEKENNGVLFLSATNIMEGGLSVESVKYIPRALHESYSNCSPSVGDVLVAKNGKTGVACVFPEGLPECSIYVSIALVRLKGGWLPDFISLVINSEIGFLQIQRNQKGIGVKNLHLEDIRQIQVPAISEENQKLIVNRYCDILNTKKSIQGRLKQLKNTIGRITSGGIDDTFASELQVRRIIHSTNILVFIRDCSVQDRLDVPANHPDYTKLVDQIKASPNSGSLSDLVETSEDRFNPEEHLGQEINYLAIGDIDGISGNIIEPQKMLAEDLPSRARRLIHAGDILVGIAGASTGTENMVVFPVTREQEGWVATTGFLVLRPRDGVDIHYVCSLLKAPFVLRQIRALLTSPAMPTISDTDFMQLAVPVTNSDARKTTLIEINRVLNEERQLTIQLEQISEQIEQLLSEAKSNIFDLLDDDKFSAISARAMGIENAMGKIEEELQ